MDDARIARTGDYVLIVHDVTNPPFLERNLDPAFLLIKLKKPKKEKVKKEPKPKFGMVYQPCDACLKQLM